MADFYDDFAEEKDRNCVVDEWQSVFYACIGEALPKNQEGIYGDKYEDKQLVEE